MNRRILVILLCLVLFVAGLPLSAMATPEAAEATRIEPLPKAEAAVPVYQLPTQADRIRRLEHDIPFHYQEAIADSGKGDLGGYCGLFAGYQLYYQGIETWPCTYNGNDFFDIYCKTSKTTGGYLVHTYQIEDYTMEEALNAATNHGTYDAYNLLVCFQWTNTEAGQKYGHVVYIYAILGGTVYFTESTGSQAGQLQACSISQFNERYAEWTTYEGTVFFGKPSFVENGFSYQADMFVKAMSETQLLSQPCSVEAQVLDTQVLRPVHAGERLRVTKMYENILGETYYRVEEDGLTGWLPAQKAGPVLFFGVQATVKDLALPTAWGESMSFGGTVSVPNAKVVLRLLDQQKQVVGEYPVPTRWSKYDLSQKSLAKAVTQETPDAGWYTWQLVALNTHQYLRDDQVTEVTQETVLRTQSVSVGTVEKRSILTEDGDNAAVKDGWYYENGTWYCYDKGQPRCGWYCSDGIDYYLKADGSVTTGTVVIGGKERIFTATGALRTGWLDTKDGRKYLLSNGVPAYGWLEIDGGTYCFDVFGIMKKSCWITEASVRRYMTEDGRMAVGNVELDGVTYHFDQNGCLAEEAAQPVSMPERSSGFLPA